jgi:hypothetical protein
MSIQNEGSLEFDHLLKKMDAARQAATDQRPAILGGHFNHPRLEAFLAEWRCQWAKMPWRIWEEVSRIGFADEPSNSNLLQQANIFGEGGHLSLRRDGDRWLWHFIGSTQPSLSSEFRSSNFWEKNGETVLRRYEESVILWGEGVDKAKTNATADVKLWHDDRVGAAHLIYPKQMSGNSRVYLHYWRYTEAGQAVFVWYRGLGDEKGVQS